MSYILCIIVCIVQWYMRSPCRCGESRGAHTFGTKIYSMYRNFFCLWSVSLYVDSLCGKTVASQGNTTRHLSFKTEK